MVHFFEKDSGKAFELVKDSAEKGLAEGQLTLGEMLENGYTGTTDRQAAIEWYKKAAKNGNKAAKKNLQRLGVQS